jgi:uncharacterized membrane protein YfcA
VGGGAAGGLILRMTSEGLFRSLVPYLILAASALLAAQPRLRAWLSRRSQAGDTPRWWGVAALVFATMYGGYFGAGVGVVLLGVLGVAFHDTLTRLNALKQVMSLGANVAAAAFFAAGGSVVWPVAAAMFASSLLGGMLGGRLANRVDPTLLRAVVVVIGVAVAVFYLVAP